MGMIELNKEPEDNIINLYKSGKNQRQIGEIFGVGRTPIRRILIKNKIVGRDSRERQKKYIFNENYFEKINTEAKAYFLGLMYADGNISESGFALSLSGERDKFILEKFKEELDSTHPISTRTIKNCLTAYIFRIHSSNKARKDLIKLGCIPRKSLTLKFPTQDQVPEEFMNHFIRGYFDGDGGVSSNNKKITYSFVSSVYFIKELHLYLKNKAGCSLSEGRYGEMGEFTAGLSGGSITSSKLFYDYIYKNCNLYLDRKREVFDNFFKYFLDNINYRIAGQPEYKKRNICKILNIEYTNFLCCELSNIKQLELINIYENTKSISLLIKQFGYARGTVVRVLKSHNINIVRNKTGPKPKI